MAAFAGAVALGQVPTALEALAIVLVMAASAGASLGAPPHCPLQTSSRYATPVEWAAYFDERTETMPPPGRAGSRRSCSPTR